jgi:hypothetical protein
MVPVTATIVSYCGTDATGNGNQFSQTLSFIRRAGNGFIQVVNIGLVVFAMVDLHGQCIDMRFQRIVGIRKWSQRKRHNFYFLEVKTMLQN